MIASARYLRVGAPAADAASDLASAATTPNFGSTAVVLDTYAGQISVISTSTGHVFAPVTVGNFPVAVAISG